MKNTYDEVYERWLNDPEDFWEEAAEAIHWHKKWDRVLDASRPPFYGWFAGGLLNTCYNALDRHVESGRADQPALIDDSLRDFTLYVSSSPVASVTLVLLAEAFDKIERDRFQCFDNGVCVG